MNCNCFFNNKYEQLCNSELSLDVHNSTSCSDTKQAEISIYNDDDSCTSVVVEENLRAFDLCQLLALKNHVAKDVNWTLVEHIDELGLERNIEDHEEVLKIFASWANGNNALGNKFYYRKDFQKYDFFRNPQNFFPPDMTDVEAQLECLSDSSELARIITLQTILNSKDDPLPLSGHLWMQEGNKNAWKKGYFVLSDGNLFYSVKNVEKDPSQLTLLGRIQNYNIYRLVNMKKNYKIPTEYCFCLKAESERKTENNDFPTFLFCCDSNKVQTSWIAALRITKYGKQLRDNYRNFKSRKSNEILNNGSKEYSSQQVPSESLRTRVAMDFTGAYGKIVDDPKEAEAIAVAEGYNWNKKLRSSKRLSASSLKGLEVGVHITQPWFHSGLLREDAVQLLNKYGTVDGVFLVRESFSTPRAFVLTFVHADKIYHTQILPMEDREQIVYSLDNGKTKFYDVLQLVEFYQLNSGSLPTKLTHYITRTARCINCKDIVITPT